MRTWWTLLVAGCVLAVTAEARVRGNTERANAARQMRYLLRVGSQLGPYSAPRYDLLGLDGRLHRASKALRDADAHPGTPEEHERDEVWADLRATSLEAHRVTAAAEYALSLPADKTLTGDREHFFRAALHDRVASLALAAAQAVGRAEQLGVTLAASDNPKAQVRALLQAVQRFDPRMFSNPGDREWIDKMLQ
jgi:hypothetical protein